MITASGAQHDVDFLVRKAMPCGQRIVLTRWARFWQLDSNFHNGKAIKLLAGVECHCSSTGKKWEALRLTRPLLSMDVPTFSTS